MNYFNKNNMLATLKLLAVVLATPLLILFSGCKKFLEAEVPPNKLEHDKVFSSDITATSAVTGIYAKMISDNTNFASGALYSVTALSGLSADELNSHVDYYATYSFFQNQIQPTVGAPSAQFLSFLWQSMFKTIYQANNILEALEISTGVSPAVKSQLRGEAYFCRAFANFYLVNSFGNVPLVLTTNFETNSTIRKASVDEVYVSIISDLLEAQLLLTDGYVQPDQFTPAERVRPNKSTATALLARVYLYKGEWQKAEQMASMIINNSLYTLTSSLDNVFLMNSSEAIWQLKPISPTLNTNEGALFILTTAGPNSSSRPLWLTNPLANSFEVGDQRRVKWINSVVAAGITYYYPFKYKKRTGPSSNPSVPLTEYSMVFRLAEQFLIRAEARARQNKIAESQSDLNQIRNRAGLGNTTATDENSLMQAIQRERRSELFIEWGHRWFDLKRWNLATSVLSPLKPNWNPGDVLYPIPENELRLNPNLNPQNPGY